MERARNKQSVDASPIDAAGGEYFAIARQTETALGIPPAREAKMLFER